MQAPQSANGARFVVLEGIDGAGTTTQTARLTEALAGHGIASHATREPSDGAIGKHLRDILTGRAVARGASAAQRAAQLALLFAADRLDHLGSEVQPALACGTWVVSDRYDYSSVAYQSVSSGDPGSVPWLRQLNKHADRPHLTLVLDVTPEVARARRLARDSQRELFDDDDLQRRLAAFYLDIEQHFPSDRIVHVDADRSVEAVFADVLAAVLALR
ncbi:MAG: Thymidylate kinase [Myxococcaceae bacterium]|nr:Thymidylate kinase [Myxococcaceae bacterium]